MNKLVGWHALGKTLGQKSVIWLLVALLFQLFVGGRWNMEIAPWISLTLFLKFSRNLTKAWYVWFGFPLFAVVTGIAMTGIIPIPFPYFYIFIAGISLLIYSGFLLDRWAIRNYESIWALMVFPSFLVVLEGIISFGPYGTWNSLAYTQSNNLYFIQLASVTGIWGITFLIGLASSIVCKVWDERFHSAHLTRLLLPLTGVVALIYIWGIIRVNSFKVDSMVRIGAYTTTMPEGNTLQDIVVKFIVRGSPANESHLYREATLVAQDQLLSKTSELADQTKVIFWSEANAIVLESDEDGFIDSLESIAREKQVYIFASLALVQFGSNRMNNKVVFITPEQRRIDEYIKSVIPPGEPSQEGPGHLKMVDTPFGKLSSAICFDMDFPTLIIQAGQAGVSILLVAALDWKEIGKIHAAMAKFRGIENGVNIFRHAQEGISSVTNAVGETLATSDYFSTEDHALIVEIPTKRLSTVYSHVGDWFLYACVALLLVLILRRKNARMTIGSE